MDTQTTTDLFANEMVSQNVLAVLPPGRKDLGKYLVSVLEAGKARWDWRVSVLCPNIDKAPFEKLVAPNGQIFLPPHFLRAADWESDPDSVRDVDQRIREAEAVTCIPMGRAILAAAHSVGRAYNVPFLHFNRYPLVLKVLKDSMEPLRIMRRFFRFADDLLEANKPDFVFFFHWVTPLNFLVWFAAQRRGIPCVALRPSKIRSDYGFWTSDPMLMNVAAIEQANVKRRAGAPVSEVAKEKIRAFREQPSMIKYIASKWQNKMRRGFLRWHLEYARIVIPEMINTWRGQDLSSRENPFARFFRYYRTLFLSFYHQHFFRTVDEAALKEMKYIYFPMHKEAEFAQTFQATLWQDQRNTIRVLASVLPFGYRLLVREHRMNFGRRRTRTYRELSEIPNVMLIDAFDSQFKYLRNADLVITENGSSGWEALLLGKRSLLVSQTFYQGAGQGLYVDDPDRLNAAILELLAKPAVADPEAYDRALGCMIDAEFESTFPMNREGNSRGLDLLPKTLGPLLRSQAKSEQSLERSAKADVGAESHTLHQSSEPGALVRANKEQSMQRLQATISELQHLNHHTRLPSRLEKMYPEISSLQNEDIKGSVDRLNAIDSVLGDRNLGEVIDLGGNSGYFCLSLIDRGMISRARVYDLSTKALAAGRAMAEHMGIGDKIEFFEQAIDLDFLRALPTVDTMLCLNLLHHAGQKFDVAKIERDGWGEYIKEWLSEMRRKCRTAIIGIGFKATKPRFWDAPHPLRPARFAELAQLAGWSILYDANVRDIQLLGVESANGRYTKGGQTIAHEPNRNFIWKTIKSILNRTRLGASFKVLKHKIRT